MVVVVVAAVVVVVVVVNVPDSSMPPQILTTLARNTLYRTSACMGGQSMACWSGFSLLVVFVVVGDGGGCSGGGGGCGGGLRHFRAALNTHHVLQEHIAQHVSLHGRPIHDMLVWLQSCCCCCCRLRWWWWWKLPPLSYHPQNTLSRSQGIHRQTTSHLEEAARPWCACLASFLLLLLLLSVLVVMVDFPATSIPPQTLIMSSGNSSLNSKSTGRGGQPMVCWSGFCLLLVVLLLLLLFWWWWWWWWWTSPPLPRRSKHSSISQGTHFHLGSQLKGAPPLPPKVCKTGVSLDVVICDGGGGGVEGP